MPTPILSYLQSRDLVLALPITIILAAPGFAQQIDLRAYAQSANTSAPEAAATPLIVLPETVISTETANTGRTVPDIRAFPPTFEDVREYASDRALENAGVSEMRITNRCEVIAKLNRTTGLSLPESCNGLVTMEGS